jgi:uncharacterized protein (TIGR00725 family)
MISKLYHQPIIGVMGGTQVDKETRQAAYQLGQMIADKGWILLNGGRDAGVMRASAQGAKERGGITVGILPQADRHQANPFIDIALATNMADARNLINVLSSDVVVACNGSAGTLSEIALALKNNKPVVTLGFKAAEHLGEFAQPGLFRIASTPEQAILYIEKYLHDVLY